MTAPVTRQVVLEVPRHNMTQEELYKFLYELRERTGGYTSNVSNLDGIKVSATQLNTLIDISTANTVQQQINTKANTADLKSMAYQSHKDVSITGGSVKNTDISGGTITIKVGDSPLNINLNGTLHTDVSTVGNVGIGEDTLISFAMPADVLANDNEFIEITACGTLASNANNKRLRLKLGATILVDSGVVAANGGSWEIKSTIIRTASNSQKSIGSLLSDNSSFGQDANYVLGAEDLAAALDIFCTAEAISDNDIVQEGLIIKWFNS